MSWPEIIANTILGAIVFVIIGLPIIGAILGGYSRTRASNSSLVDGKRTNSRSRPSNG